MDSSQSSGNPGPIESGIDNDLVSPTSNVPEPIVMPSLAAEDSVPPVSVASEHTQENSESETQSSTPPTIDSEELEHAYWAEYEEDNTTPDEEELKEIEGSEADYSARDRRLHPDL